jgi:hypothetical protein
VLDLAVAAAPATNAELSDLDDRWGVFLRSGQIQGRISSCAAEEAAEIEAERQAELAAQRARNCGVPLFPEDSCPTDAELAAERSAEALCGGGHCVAHHRGCQRGHRAPNANQTGCTSIDLLWRLPPSRNAVEGNAGSKLGLGHSLA